MSLCVSLNHALAKAFSNSSGCSRKRNGQQAEWISYLVLTLNCVQLQRSMEVVTERRSLLGVVVHVTSGPPPMVSPPFSQTLHPSLQTVCESRSLTSRWFLGQGDSQRSHWRVFLDFVAAWAKIMNLDRYDIK